MRKFALMLFAIAAVAALAATSALAAPASSPVKKAWNSQIRMQAPLKIANKKAAKALSKAMSRTTQVRATRSGPQVKAASGGSYVSNVPCGEQDPGLNPTGRQAAVYFPEDGDPFMIAGASGFNPTTPDRYYDLGYAFGGSTAGSFSFDGIGFRGVDGLSKYVSGWGCWNVENFEYYDEPVCTTYTDPDTGEEYEECEYGEYRVTQSIHEELPEMNLGSLKKFAASLRSTLYFLGDCEEYDYECYPTVVYLDTAGITLVPWKQKK